MQMHWSSQGAGCIQHLPSKEAPTVLAALALTLSAQHSLLADSVTLFSQPFVPVHLFEVQECTVMSPNGHCIPGKQLER